MLGESKNESAWILLALAVVKALRAFSLVGGSTVLHVYDYPVTIFTFHVLLGSSILMLILQRPWMGKKAILPQQWVRIAIYAIALLLNYLLFNIGLKYYGPLRAILSYDYADLAVNGLFTALFSAKGKALNSEKIQGVVLVAVAYLLLYFGDLSSITVTPTSGVVNVGEESFNFFLFNVHSSHIGGICLFLAICLSLVRRHLSKTFATEIGGPKRLYGLALPVATIMLLPFAVISYLSNDIMESYFSSAVFPRITGVVVFGLVVDFFAENFISTNKESDLSLISKISLSASFVAVCFFDWINVSNSPFIAFLSFFLLIYGMHLTFSKKSSSSLPTTYSAYGGTQQTWSTATFIRTSMKVILEGRDTRRIFFYLCANLAFMFVEMFYGMWTNSLSLISDACHMLFDSTALVIGLFAAIIARWEPNKEYSYGYGRVEVLSGFINGVFLIFIAFVVLMESAERFFNPQEINTDSLLTVSVLGLLVNLVGVFAFHDLHGGGDHAGHSHSHGGHSHGHDHGHKEKKVKKEKKEKHGHSHDHGHGHSHNDDHGHSHSHGHHDDHHDDHHDHHDHHDDHHDHKHHKHHGDEEQNEEYQEAREDSNIYGVYLHILADTLGSVGVIVSCLLISWKGWVISDPITSFIISLMIFFGVLPLIKSSASALLQTTPDDFGKKLDRAYSEIMNVPGVVGYDRPHFWKQSKDLLVGTIHIQINNETTEQKALAQVSKIFKKRGVKDLTVEVAKTSTFI